jgi:hypothetical protein
MVVGARSLKLGQVGMAEILVVVATCPERIRRQLREGLDDLDDHGGDVQIVDGDLHVAGDLDLHHEGIYLLVVRGSLNVDGAYCDSDDPASCLVVTGSMKVRDVVTAGWLEVQGDLEVSGSLIGDYNDCAAHIGGKVRTHLFYPEEHAFDVAGSFTAEVAIGNHLRLTAARKPRFIPMSDPRLADVFDQALIRFHDDEDEHGRPISIVDGLRDFRELKRRVRAGEPLG